MIVGAFGALPQTNLKRLLGYSSIANMGYALVAVAAGVQYGAGLAAHLHDRLCDRLARPVWRGLSMRREGGMVEDINELAGLIRRQPGLASALTLLLISVSGFPLAFGFLGKLAVLEAGD